MLVVEGLTKSYGTNRVLRGVDLRVESGRVRALLGPNGAGKSSLIGCLSGATTADAGVIELDGQRLERLNPRTSQDAGIAVIYQHFSLVDELNVDDNVFLGHEQSHLGLVSRSRQRAITNEILGRLDVELPRDAPVRALSTGQRQLVEIAKALRAEPKVLILDEPTAALGAHEASALVRAVRALAASGIAIIYVSHLLEEIPQVADDVSVLRDGQVVLDRAATAASERELVEAIAPGTTAIEAERNARDAPTGAAVISALGLTGPGFGPLDLEVRPGEIVGVFGMLGSGRTELLETLAGTRRATGGTLAVASRRRRRWQPAAAKRAGVHLVPSDRGTQGLFSTLRSDENVLLPTLNRLAGRFGRDRSAERDAFADVAGTLDIRPSTPGAIAGRLSGGNQQKLLLGRWLHRAVKPTVLLLDEPTQGVDVGARNDLYRQIHRSVADRGVAVVFSSSDPDEVGVLADRCVVLHRGRIAEQLRHAELTHENLLAAAHRAPDHEEPK